MSTLKRVSVLTLACLAFAVQAQGLRRPGQTGATPARAAVTLPAAPLGPQQADYIVALVNSEPVTNNEVRQRMGRVLQQMAAAGAPQPSMSELSSQVLERIINEKAQLQVARETGIKIDDAAVDLAEQSVARQNQVTVAELRARLVADGMSVAQLRDDLRNQLTLSRLRDRELESRSRVSDIELDQYLQEQQGNPDAQLTDVNIAQVLVAVPENASSTELARLQARAEQVASRARAGDDFGALAREFSDGAERNNGGQMGLRAVDRYPELFVSAVARLPVNGIAGPIRSGAGFHVLKLVEKNQGQTATTVTQSHARHILLRTSARLDEATARSRLADYRRRIVGGQADFAELARQHSQDGSARAGGDLGWVSPGQFVPEFEEVLNSLSPGQVSEPLVSRFGVHLIQLLERREVPLSDREKREIARGMLREKKLDDAYAVWAQEVRGRAYVEYRDPPY